VLELGSFSPEWFYFSFPTHQFPVELAFFNSQEETVQQAWLYWLVVDFYFLHPSSLGLGFHSPCCVTLARIFPTGYQTTYWDPSCTFFLKQRRDLHKEPTQGTTSTMECPA
jgi:hypothetical protein